MAADHITRIGIWLRRTEIVGLAGVVDQLTALVYSGSPSTLRGTFPDVEGMP